MPKLENEIIISSKGKNYLVNIKINKIKNNSYYGDMYFANLSEKDIELKKWGQRKNGVRPRYS